MILRPLLFGLFCDVPNFAEKTIFVLMFDIDSILSMYQLCWLESNTYRYKVLNCPQNERYV